MDSAKVVREFLEREIPRIESHSSISRDSDLQDAIRKKLASPKDLSFLFARPFNRKERQVFAFLKDGEVIVRMLKKKGQWVVALPRLP